MTDKQRIKELEDAIRTIRDYANGKYQSDMLEDIVYLCDEALGEHRPNSKPEAFDMVGYLNE